MRITDLIWKEDIVDKLLGKHKVRVAEAEEVFASGPVVRKLAKGRVRGEDVYAALAQIGIWKIPGGILHSQKARRRPADFRTRDGPRGKEILCQTTLGK